MCGCRRCGVGQSKAWPCPQGSCSAGEGRFRHRAETCRCSGFLGTQACGFVLCLPVTSHRSGAGQAVSPPGMLRSGSRQSWRNQSAGGTEELLAASVPWHFCRSGTPWGCPRGEWTWCGGFWGQLATRGSPAEAGLCCEPGRCSGSRNPVGERAVEAHPRGGACRPPPLRSCQQPPSFSRSAPVFSLLLGLSWCPRACWKHPRWCPVLVSASSRVQGTQGEISLQKPLLVVAAAHPCVQLPLVDCLSSLRCDVRSGR